MLRVLSLALLLSAQAAFGQSLEAVRAAAAQGSAEAQTELANRYRDGTGLLQSYARAALWYSKAAEQGDPQAMHGLDDPIGSFGVRGDVGRREFFKLAAKGIALGAAGLSLSQLVAMKEAYGFEPTGALYDGLLTVFFNGAPSQTDTWDPKPGRPTGGPFSAIPTNTTGIHISELLPKLAQRQQHTASIATD